MHEAMSKGQLEILGGRLMAKTDISIGDLVSMIHRGELQLPEMQRRYVWTSTRVRDLLDSLYRGYPSGTILVWETDSSAPTREMAVVTNSSFKVAAKEAHYSR
jgi:uncharacterized protein with ParB-like and HNH nuclease domain